MEMKTDKPDSQEIKLENIIAFNKRKRQQMLRSMITTSQSHSKVNKQMQKEAGNAELFKRKIWKQELRSRIDYRRKENLKKINKIKVKVKKV